MRNNHLMSHDFDFVQLIFSDYIIFAFLFTIIYSCTQLIFLLLYPKIYLYYSNQLQGRKTEIRNRGNKIASKLVIGQQQQRNVELCCSQFVICVHAEATTNKQKT